MEEMQVVLDAYLNGYYQRRLHQGRGMMVRTPARAFVEGLLSATEPSTPWIKGYTSPKPSLEP
ncbi:MAG: hypothetical protein K2Y05_05655 [Hyphomicrobiaceae bacterium]|nr:hypothetical protein [Hyphomicrobiaceae bacterium]